MLQVENGSPFEVAIHVFPDTAGIDTLYTAVKATFSVDGGRPAVAEEQVPLWAADEYWGEPGVSSVRYAGEAHLSKPYTDVVLNGCAQLPGGRRASQLEASVSVGPVRRSIRVFGDREWSGSRFWRTYSPPELFEKMPLVWERAFGGVHEVDPEEGKILAEGRNPLGRGFRGKRKRKSFAGELMPNLEDPRALLGKPGDRQDPCCFGFVAPSWQPRIGFAGTYDEAWQARRAPYLPADFDSRFFLTAPQGLSSPRYLTGGEPVELVNVSPKGPLRFELPRCALDLRARVAGTEKPLVANLETVFFEPEASRFCMTWRAALGCDKQVLKVEKVSVVVDRLEGVA